jgi:carbonic anhydrase
MASIAQLVEDNRAWVSRTEKEKPGFFKTLAKQQKPEYLWIGCADSRVPANEIVGLLPGELFVHRNVANMVIHADMNCLSVLQYAVEVLRVKHVIVCGHYECGGVKAAMSPHSHGMIDNWLRPIEELYRRRKADLQTAATEEARFDRLCEMNVVEQALNVANTTIIQEAWSQAQPVTVHGWIYNVANGLLKDLGVSLSSPAEVERAEARLAPPH